MSLERRAHQQSIGSERDLDNLSDIPSILSESPGTSRQTTMSRGTGDFGERFKAGRSKPPHHEQGHSGSPAWAERGSQGPLRSLDGNYSLDLSPRDTTDPAPSTTGSSQVKGRKAPPAYDTLDLHSVERDSLPPTGQRPTDSQDPRSSHVSHTEDGTPVFSVDVRMPRYGSHLSYDAMLDELDAKDPFNGDYTPSGKKKQDGKKAKHPKSADNILVSGRSQATKERSTSESVVRKIRKKKKKDKHGSDSLNSTATFVLESVSIPTSAENHAQEDAGSVDSNKTFTVGRSESRQRLLSGSHSDIAPLQNSQTQSMLKQKRLHLSKKVKVRGLDNKERRMYVEQGVITDYISQTVFMRECNKYEPDRKVKDKCMCGRDLLWHMEKQISIPHPSPEKHVWHHKTHTEKLPCDSFGDIHFRGFGHFTRNSPYVRLDCVTDMEVVWNILTELWRLPIPKLLISVTGGAKRFDLKPRLRAILKQGLVHAAASTGAWIITGGTATGVMGFVGEAVREYLDTGGEAHQSKIIALGIATWGAVSNKAALDDEGRQGLWPATYAVEDLHSIMPGTAPLDHNHTHFLLVDDGTEGKYGGEIEFRSNLEHYISNKVTTGVADSQNVQVPVVQVVVEGGINTMQTVYETIKLDTPVVVIEGSGRAADFIALGYKMTRHPTSEDRCMWPSDFDDEMKRKARTMFVWKNTDDAVDKKIAECLRHLKKTLERRHLLNIFRLDDADSVKDIDRAILYALLKANKKNCYGQLCLALAWDRCDIARQEIFTVENRHAWNPVDLYDAMFTALVQNRPDFVRLFLDNGVDLKKFLTIRTLWKLYARTVNDRRSTQAEILRYLISYMKQTWGAYFCCRDTEFGQSDPKLLQYIGKVLSHLLYDRALNFYEDDKFELKNMPKRKTMTWEGDRQKLTLRSHYSQNSNAAGETNPRLFRHLTETSDGSGVDASGSVTARRRQKRIQEHYDFSHPERDLLIWALLLNRQELAHMFWRLGTCHLGGALVACSILNRLSCVADDEEEIELCTNLEHHAKLFENLACNVLSDCYFRNKTMSHQLLVRRLQHWGGVTLLSLADQNGLMEFTDHTCVQTKLNAIWKGRLALYTQEWKICLCILLPILVPFIKFSTNREISWDDDWNDDDDDDDEEDNLDGNGVDGDCDGKTRGMEMKPQTSNQVSPADGGGDGGEGENSKPFVRSPTRRTTELKHRLYKVKLFDYGSNDISLFSAILYFYAAPVTKMMANVFSYLVFLAIFSYFVLVELHESTISHIEYITWGWLITMFFEEIRQVFMREQMEIRHRIVSWFSNMWNRFDLLMYVMFIISVALRFGLYESAFVWARVFYSICLILFYIRFLHFFFAQKNMGPKVIMIYKMLMDLMFFVMILAVFILGFGVAYHANLYPNSSPSWNILVNVLYLPYWQMYGELFLDRVEGGDDPSGCTRNETIWRQDAKLRCPESNWLVVLLLALYMILTNVLLLNLLIAMFSYTFQTVQDNATKVWRYYRLSLVYEYSYRPTLAPPVIIFNHVWRLFRLCFQHCCDRCKKPDPLMVDPSDEEMTRLNIFERIAVDNYLVKKALQNEALLDTKITNAAQRIDRVMDELGHIKENLEQSEINRNKEQHDTEVAQFQPTPPSTSRPVTNTEYLRHCIDDLGSQVMEHSKKLDELMKLMKQTLSLPKKSVPHRQHRHRDQHQEELTDSAAEASALPSIDVPAEVDV